jgi:hypothetical protein
MHIEGNSLIYVVHDYHKKSNKITYAHNSHIFRSAIKLSLILAVTVSWTAISFSYQLCYMM